MRPVWRRFDTWNNHVREVPRQVQEVAEKPEELAIPLCRAKSCVYGSGRSRCFHTDFPEPYLTIYWNLPSLSLCDVPRQTLPLCPRSDPTRLSTRLIEVRRWTPEKGCSSSPVRGWVLVLPLWSYVVIDRSSPVVSTVVGRSFSSQVCSVRVVTFTCSFT